MVLLFQVAKWLGQACSKIAVEMQTRPQKSSLVPWKHKNTGGIYVQKNAASR